MSTKNPFRLIFTNKNANLNLSLIEDLIEWRNYQFINDYNFLVIKLGHINTLHTINFDNVFNLFKDIKYLHTKPVIFSLFSNLDTLLNLPENVLLFNDFIIKMQNINPLFKGAIAWNFDFLHNTSVDINLIPIKPSHLQYNLYLHHFNDIEKGMSLLDYTHLFSGFDITSYFNNFENPNFDNRSILFNFFNVLKEKKPEFLEDLSPEYLSMSDNDNNFRNDITKFCQEGYIIDNDTISPLIYGSFDDFTIKGSLLVPDFLLMTYEDIHKYFTKIWTREILSSYCSSCDFFNICQSKLYYWNNIQSDTCSLNIEQNLPLSFTQKIK